MTSDSPDAPAPARATVTRLLDEAGWSALVDCLVAGIRHSLNGRAGALMGLAELVRAGDDPEFTVEALSDEARKVERLGLALANLSARGEERAEVLAMHERLPILMELFGHQPGIELLDLQVSVEPDCPAVRAPWGHLSRALLIASSVVSAQLLDDGGRGTLHVSCRGVDGQAVFTAAGEPRDGSGFAEPSAAYLVQNFRAWPPALEQAITTLGGETQRAGPRVEIRLPSAR